MPFVLLEILQKRLECQLQILLGFMLVLSFAAFPVQIGSL